MPLLSPKVELWKARVSCYVRNILRNPAGIKAYYSKNTLPLEPVQISVFPATMWSDARTPYSQSCFG
jgi:hypothetical protein